MKVILRQDVEKLGKEGDIIETADGYARNHLIPKKLAYEASPGKMKQLEHERKITRDRQDKSLKGSKKLADQLDLVSCTITMRAGEDDKLFGSVTSALIAEALEREGFELDKKMIILEEPIKSLGVFSVPVRVAPGVETKLKVWVVKE